MIQNLETVQSVTQVSKSNKTDASSKKAPSLGAKRKTKEVVKKASVKAKQTKKEELEGDSMEMDDDELDDDIESSKMSQEDAKPKKRR